MTKHKSRKKTAGRKKFTGRKKFAVGGALTAAIVIAIVSWLSTREASSLAVTVYKAPWCGCCTKWADHLRANGFDVTTENVEQMWQVRLRHGVEREISSCHTAIVGGYVVEGHVPADVILRLLKEQPRVVGITVPGMPMGSPGMEGAYKEPYKILTFDREGNTEVYAER